MQISRDEIKAEKVNYPWENKILSDLVQEARDAHGLDDLSDEDLVDKIEQILLEKIKTGDKKAYFQLGLFYYEQHWFDKARLYFERSKIFDYQSLYQLAVMLYDGVGGQTNASLAVEYLLNITYSGTKMAKHLHHAVQFNLGRAFFQGYGVPRQSDELTEKWWLQAADDGNPSASVKAQSHLGMYYSREETLNLKLAFFWHSEACGNGNLESQGALGIMYEFGIGVKQCRDSAYVCLKDASDRGNVYAMGNLVSHYYKRKLFTKAADLAKRVAQLEDVDLIADETDCLRSYIEKGISLACFYYARCLVLGLGTEKKEDKAAYYYSRCYDFDPDTCARLQHNVQHGTI